MRRSSRCDKPGDWLPDIHSCFGLPIGGVMAADVQKGVISAGAVGMDINCGVRLLYTNLAKETFYSVNHGAGRVLSRKKAAQSVSDKDLALALALGGILVNTKRLRSLADEAPAAYKDIEEVIATLTEVGITLPLARFLPLAVVKGEGSEG